MALGASVVKAHCGVGPVPGGAVRDTLGAMQVHDVDGVDVCAAGAVGAQQVAGGTVYIAEPALVLSDVLVLAIGTIGQAVGG